MKITYLFAVLFLLSCMSEAPDHRSKTGEGTAQTTVNQNLNVSFLLDLSDRIDPKKYPDQTMEYYQRDVQYIRSVEKAFVRHVQGKKLILLNDNMQVFFEPAPKNPVINKLSDQLKVSFTKITSKEAINATDKIYSAIPLKIYQSAINDKAFVGSDIWRFFKNSIKDYCIKENRRNILVILTDGYMYHPNSKFLNGNRSSYLTPEFIRSKKLTTTDYQSVMKKNNLGFIPATSGLHNLEVLVLGINPSKKNPFEEDVIKQYWSDWLTAMNVRKFALKTADLPSALDPVIQKFILGK